jgi:hypothetical protein
LIFGTAKLSIKLDLNNLKLACLTCILVFEVMTQKDILFKSGESVSIYSV